MSRIVQVANFVTPTSGGLRTTLAHLAEGYAGQGHEVVQVLPSDRAAVEHVSWGRRVLLPGRVVPGTGYRLLCDRERVTRVLAELEPEVLEVHDRTTLRGLGRWASAQGVRSLVVSHERLDRWLEQWLPPRLPLTHLADRSNAALAADFDTVVCSTSWAAEEFRRVGATNLVQVPLGVDHTGFTARLSGLRRDGVHLAMVSRLSREKRPDLALDTVRELRRRGLDARLIVCGDGALRRQLELRSAGLPVQWRGFVGDRSALAAVMAEADVVLAPGPVESFGLAALEALACGTPVVVHRRSALPEVVGEVAGRAVAGSGFVFADAVLELLSVDEPVRRAAARRQSERYVWATTVAGFLGVHGLLREPIPA